MKFNRAVRRVIVVVGIMGGVVLVTDSAGAGKFNFGTVNDAQLQQAEGVSPERAEEYAGMLADYDPREIDHLMATKDEGFGDVSDQLLVSTLEFRRSCRLLNAAVEASDGAAVGTADRTESVRGIMDAQIARVRERSVKGDETPAMWESLTSDLIEGKMSLVDFVLKNDCAHSFDPVFTDR